MLHLKNQPVLYAAATLLIVACNAAPPVVSVETVLFSTQSGEFEGTLRVPTTDRPTPLLVLFHAASGGSADFPFYDHLKNELPERGIATLVYNRRGTGGQPGSFETASFEDLAADGIAAADKLKTDPRIDSRRIGAWGISQGGWVAPLAAVLSEQISFAVSVSGPGVSPAAQMSFTAEYHLREAGFSDQVIETALDLRSKIDAYYRAPSNRAELQELIDGYRETEWFSTAFLPNGGYLPEDVSTSKWYYEMDFDPAVTIARLEEPFLVIFGSKDRWVPVEASVEAIREAVPTTTPLTVYVSEHSGHLMSGQDESFDYAGELPVEPAYLDRLVAWIEALPHATDTETAAR